QHLRHGADPVRGLMALLAAGTLSLAGCAGLMPGGAPPARHALAEAQRARAETLERDGALRAALGAINVALAVEPDDRGLRESKLRLQTRIEQGVAEQTAAARVALVRKAYLEARRH